MTPVTDDPFDWTVDEVAASLCDIRTSWTNSTAAPRLPEPKTFEQALRDHEIDGTALLLHLNDASLREDLGIKSLGHRATLMCAVRKLRAHSQKYHEYIQEFASQMPLPGSDIIGSPGLLSRSGFGSPFYGYRQSPVLSPVRGIAVADEAPIAQAKLRYTTLSDAFIHTPKLPRPDQAQFLSDKIIDTPQSPSRTFEAGHSSSPPPPLVKDAHQFSSGAEGDSALSADPATPLPAEESAHRSGETYVIDESGRKRRRLTLVPDESEISNHLDTEKDEAVVDETALPPELPEAGKLMIDANGRKRMRPMLVSPPANEVIDGSGPTPEVPSISLRLSANSGQVSEEEHPATSRDSYGVQRLTYLGPKSLPVDDLFYAGVAIGEQVRNDVQYEAPAGIERPPGSEAFFISNEHLANGQRLYVNKLIKYFLGRSERRDFNRKGQDFTAIIPYSERIGKKHSIQSFTLFSPSSSDIRATREDRSKWSSAYRSTISNRNTESGPDSAFTQFNIPDDDPFTLGGDSNENHDWDFLEKWRCVDQGDRLLPVYLESGSEGEYDLDTWREVEEERGTLARPMGISKRKQLTRDEVSSAIDQGIEQLEARWRTKLLPLRESKAWRLWTKSRRDGNKHLQIEQAMARIDYLNDIRLSKMRKEMTSEVWSNSMQIRKQCRIMEESIFEREDQKWRVTILQLKSAPPRPPPRDKSQPVKVPSTHDSLGEDEEILESDVDDAESSDEGLEDFIIDEDPHELQEGHIISEADRLQDADDEHVLDGDNNDTDADEEIVTPGSEKRLTRLGWYPDPDSNLAKLSNIGESPVPELVGANPSPKLEDKTSPSLPLDYPAPSSILSSARSIPDPFTSTPFGTGGRRRPIRQEDIIDLTIPSDPPGPDKSGNDSDPYINSIRTPPLNPVDDNPFRDAKKPRSEFRVPPMPSSIINLESESSPTSREDTEHEHQEELPNLSDVEGISRLDASYLVERQDRKRLLIRYLHRLSPQDRQGIIARTIAVKMDESRLDVWNGLAALKAHAHKIRGAESRTSDDIMRIAQLYVCWSQNTKHSPHGHPKKLVERTMEDVAGFECFYTFLCERLARYESEIVEDPIIIDSTPEKGTRRSGKRKLDTKLGFFAGRVKRSDSEDSHSLSQHTPHKRRKNAVQESVVARDVRTNDQQRVQDQERRRRQLMQLQKTEVGHGEVPPMIVNVSKFEHQDLIHLNAGIATKIKPHQLEGVQFMWRELITDERSLQGCLLAHTMGLGKTMQVITLLVTIAETAKSPNTNLQNQIPKGLRESRTLILCPPSLIDNWWDEFLIWAPVPIENNVGQLRKVASGSRKSERLQEISAWNKDGGILIISYDMFRLYVHNKATKTGGPPLNDKQHAKVKKELLDGPNIIVADEAHKMKNVSSATTSAANGLRSKSRIALTGSPLANNLEEYYAMINWIAPGYLGDIVQFKARYVEPIQEGLYQNSTSHEKRHCLKMLQVLKQDLAPKINRADIGVLKGSLKAKTEFVIKVPLTKLQEDAYRLYVRSMLGDAGDDKLANTRLWDWLAILSLLCNHPLCFRNKLLEREAKAQESPEALITKPGQSLSIEGAANSEDESAPGDGPISKLGVSQSMVQEQLLMFDSLPAALDSIDHSHKVKVFNQILDASIAANDKVLVFSHSIPTLDYLEDLFKQTKRNYARLDGKTKMSDRQKLTKDFNSGKKQVCLISTRAGGLGLNLFGANRVIIFDFGFNPIWEEQAVGRAYRIGQKKPVFVYRFTAGGTFEDRLHNQAVFKTQLASRVVDKKNPARFAMKGVRQYLFEPKPVEQKDLSDFYGKDPLVLDGILASDNPIRSIELTETFHQEDNDKLTAEEEKEAEQILKDEQLKRTDPAAYLKLVTGTVRDPAQPQHMGDRFQSTIAQTMAGPQPARDLRNPLHIKPHHGTNILSATTKSPAIMFPSLPPVAGANTKVKRQLGGSSLHAIQPMHDSLGDTPSEVVSTPAVTPSTAVQNEQVTEEEILASIPPEGIRPQQLWARFRRRIGDDKSFMEWVMSLAKYNPLTDKLKPRDAR